MYDGIYDMNITFMAIWFIFTLLAMALTLRVIAKIIGSTGDYLSSCFYGMANSLMEALKDDKDREKRR